MNTDNSILSMLTGQELVIRLEHTLTERFPDFQEVHMAYQCALDVLREVLGEQSTPSVEEVADAINRQTASNLVFAGALGLKANLDHFRDTLSPTVLDVDFEVFLREQEARTLPEYEQAQEVLHNFYSQLEPVQRGLYEPVLEYISYLETVAPKLAHFYGYQMGDQLLERIVPGYQADVALTERYQKMLQAYLDIELK